MEEETEKKSKSFLDYAKSLGDYGLIPHDQFSHQYLLLKHRTREIKDYPDIFDMHILLSNIKDSKTLYFLQQDFTILTDMYSLTRRLPEFKELFECLYHGWLGSVRMTASLGSKERTLQSFMQPIETGYELSFWERRKREKERKKLKEYLTPGEETIYE